MRKIQRTWPQEEPVAPKMVAVDFKKTYFNREVLSLITKNLKT